MKKKAIAHNILGALSNFVFLFLTGILLLPYYFKFISTSEYGIWLGGISFLSLVSIFEANISLILTQQLGSKWVAKQPLEFSKYFSSAMIFGVAVSIVVIISTFFLKDTLTLWISAKNRGNTLFSDSFFLYSISLSLTIITGYLGSIFQVFLITAKPPIYNLIASIFGIIYTILAVPTQGILAIAVGNLIKSFVYTLLISFSSVTILRTHNIPFYIDFNYLSKLIQNIGLPFISKLMMTLATSIQNFIVATAISASATTIFDITKKLPFMTIMIINMIAVSTFTSFALFYSENVNSTVVHEYTKQYFSLIRVLLVVSLTIIFLIGQDFVTLWVGADKFGGNLLLGLICMVALSDQLRMILSQQYYAIGKFNLTSITDSIYAVGFLIVAILLVPLLGLKGIVLAGISANIIYFLVCLFLEKRSKVEMVSHILTKSLIIDLFIVLILSGITTLVLQSMVGNMLVKITIIGVSVAILAIIYIKKERVLFNFIISKFLKS